MNRPITSPRLKLLASGSTGSRTDVAVKRYRLARARLDGRSGLRVGGQSAPIDSARSSRSASPLIP